MRQRLSDFDAAAAREGLGANDAGNLTEGTVNKDRLPAQYNRIEALAPTPAQVGSTYTAASVIVRGYQSEDATHAFMAFEIPAVIARNLGVDRNGDLRFGGNGGPDFEVWHAGNLDPEDVDAATVGGWTEEGLRHLSNATGTLAPSQSQLRPDQFGGIGSFTIGIYYDAGTTIYDLNSGTYQVAGSAISDPAPSAYGNRYYSGLWRIMGYIGINANGHALHLFQRIS